MLDKHFFFVLQLSTVRHRKRANFFKEIFFVIQSWIHPSQKRFDLAAAEEMRFSGSLSGGLCANFDNTKYLPTLGGLDRLESRI